MTVEKPWPGKHAGGLQKWHCRSRLSDHCPKETVATLLLARCWESWKHIFAGRNDACRWRFCTHLQLFVCKPRQRLWCHETFASWRTFRWLQRQVDICVVQTERCPLKSTAPFSGAVGCSQRTGEQYQTIFVDHHTLTWLETKFLYIFFLVDVTNPFFYVRKNHTFPK